MVRSSELRQGAERRIGKYLKEKWRLDELIGVGGTAGVYAATHRNGSRVAVKVLHRHLCASEHQVRRFLREAYTANRVGHPGAVAVHDDDVDGDDAFLVMELLDGSNLKDHAEARGGRLSLEDTLKHADQLLDVLKEAHAGGIVHRDIKPSNLFLTRSGALKVLDFGVAHSRMAPADGQTTVDGDVVGTPAFMAPEQARGQNRQVDARADVWSVGATLFTLLSGELVHPATTASEHLGLTMSTSPRPFSSVRPDLPAAVCQVIDRCLRHDPAQRWPSVTELQNALRALDASGALVQPRASIDSEPEALSTATLPAPTPSRKSREWGMLAGVALLGVAGLLVAAAPHGEVSARLSKTLDARRDWALPSKVEQGSAARASVATGTASALKQSTLQPSTPARPSPPVAHAPEPATKTRPSTKPRERVPQKKAEGHSLDDKHHSNNPLDWRH